MTMKQDIKFQVFGVTVFHSTDQLDLTFQTYEVSIQNTVVGVIFSHALKFSKL